MAHMASISAVVRLWGTSKIESTGDADLLFGCTPWPPVAAVSLLASPLDSAGFVRARPSAAAPRAFRHTVGAGAGELEVWLVFPSRAWSGGPASARDSRHGREDVGAGGTSLSTLGDVIMRELDCCFCGR